MAKMNLTQRTIESLPVPEGKRACYLDSECAGFGLMVQPSGKKSFYWYRKLAGYPKHVTIGEYPSLSVGAARLQAEQINGKVAAWKASGFRGPSPLDRPQAATIGGILDAYIAEHIKSACQNPEQAAKRTRWMFDKYLVSWKNRAPDSLQKSHIRARWMEISEKHGEHIANRVLQLLKAMFYFAVSAELYDQNPAAGISQHRERARERFLQPDELPKFFSALFSSDTPEMLREIVLVALFTGARASNVFAMRWAHLDLERGVWNLSAIETKSGVAYSIALAPDVVSILKKRRERDASSEWVFPSVMSDCASGHVIDVNYQWRRFLKRAGLANFRFHDLRRSIASWQAAAGTSLLLIAKSLGHSDTKSTQVYARLNLDPVRVSVAGAVESMLAAGGDANRRMLRA